MLQGVQLLAQSRRAGSPWETRGCRCGSEQREHLTSAEPCRVTSAVSSSSAHLAVSRVEWMLAFFG